MQIAMYKNEPVIYKCMPCMYFLSLFSTNGILTRKTVLNFFTQHFWRPSISSTHSHNSTAYFLLLQFFTIKNKPASNIIIQLYKDICNKFLNNCCVKEYRSLNTHILVSSLQLIFIRWYDGNFFFSSTITPWTQWFHLKQIGEQVGKSQSNPFTGVLSSLI